MTADSVSTSSADLSGIVTRRVESTEDVLEFLRWLGERRPALGVDTETSGLSWVHDKLRLVQMGDALTGWSFYWHDWAGLIKDVLPRYDGDLVFHNAKFDVHMLEGNGVKRLDWKRIHDTRPQAHIIDPGHATGLKPLGARYINPRIVAGEAVLNNAKKKMGWDWGTVPLDFPGYWAYAALDPIITCRLHDLPEFEAVRKTDLYEMERRSQSVIYDMELRGVAVDLPHCINEAARYHAYAMEVAEWARATYGLGSITSNDQVAAKFQELGITLTAQTPTGKWKMDKETIGRISHELAVNVLLARKAYKIANTYLGNFAEMQVDGILHCDVNPLGARTGRMSVSRPALQTLTRGKGPVRDSFISRYGPDGRIVLIDYDQIEMRLYAGLAEDPELIGAFGSGDFFTTITRELFEDPTIGKHDERRQNTKNARYARNYGAGVPKIARTWGVEQEVVQSIEDRWTERYPVAARFPQEIERRARENGDFTIYTYTGRKQVATKTTLYKLVNYFIQGTAGDVLKQAVIRLAEAGLDEYMVLLVHDEIVFDAPADVAVDVARRASEIMRVPAEQFGVELTCGADIVERWGDKYADEPGGELDEEGEL
jgi:DNA polymerase-1